MNWKERVKSTGRWAWRKLGAYRLVFLVILAGLVLLLLPEGKEKTPSAQCAPAETFHLEQTEQKLAQALSKIDGAGEVTVLLTVKTGTRQVLAQDLDSEGAEGGQKTQTVVLAKGSGQEETVTVQEIYPQYQGALVVCGGGENPQVRLALTQAITALTGLGADKISISKGK